MFSRALSAVIIGIDSIVVQVESDVSSGLPFFELVGCLSSEVKEARERVKTAIRNSGFQLDPKRIIVNLSPADTKKSGSCYDLAIACSILCAYEMIPQSSLDNTLIVGELSLDGSVRAVRGILPIVLMAREMNIERCIVPKENAMEGACVNDINVYGVSSLKELAAFLKGELSLEKTVYDEEKEMVSGDEYDVDFSEIHGQRLLKRSMEIAASGLHNILIVGSPGSGKSMAAKRLPGILPEMSYEESLELSKIYSVSGLLAPNTGLIKKRPFRSPHHTASAVGLSGGGNIPSPGEVSLAHRGVLFLDELTEFDNEAMEVMRQPLEDGVINITRVHSSCVFPAVFMLVAAMNPCKCGFYPDAARCTCTPLQIQRYVGRISRPLLDRIDITVEVKNVNIEMLQDYHEKDESSEEIRRRVVQAGEIQKMRYKGLGYEHNSQIPDKDIVKFCPLGTEETAFMKMAYKKYALSARGYNKILKVARSIADLNGQERINVEHLSEAVFFKSLDRAYWSGTKL